jgi:hypothetical protein
MVNITTIFPLETIRRRCGAISFTLKSLPIRLHAKLDSNWGHESPKKASIIVDGIRGFFLAAITYVVLSVFFLFGVVTSRGNVAEADWSIPLTASAALNIFHSLLFVWSYNGFGYVTIGNYGFPFFPILNAALAPFGFVGGTEIKLLSISLVALAGITMYLLARSFGLGFLSSFLSGLFFMTTAVVFNWLMQGYIFYLIAYDLLPLMILTTKKFLETNDLRYALINGIILSIAMAQPASILIYPLLGFLFVLFESRGCLKIIRRGLVLTAISLSIWLLTALSFLTSRTVALSFYQGNYFSVMVSQFYHFSSLIDPIRLWGSTFNYQFETYFPKELILLSFLPLLLGAIGLLLRPRDRRVLFCSLAYLFVFVSYLSYINLHYLVSNLPYGSIFELPSIFLVPASLGLALLIGYANQGISRVFTKFGKVASRHLVRNACFIIILILVISASIPWWTGQTSGTPIFGPALKLNLYQIPSGYTEWSNVVAGDNEHFVLCLPGGESAPIGNTGYFSQSYGPYGQVNDVIYSEVNNLPCVSASNSSWLLNELLDGNSQVGEIWGSFSIKYIVVYTNVGAPYNVTDILSRLSSQSGIVQVASFPDVVVYQDEYAKPVVYADSSNATVEITYHDPTMYKVQANSTSPYFLVLNQFYATGWTASVNGTKLATHIEDSNGFNSWYINYTGNMTIDIYYEPQTTYIAALTVSIVVVLSVSLYLILATVRKVRRNQTVKNNQACLHKINTDQVLVYSRH